MKTKKSLKHQKEKEVSIKSNELLGSSSDWTIQEELEARENSFPDYYEAKEVDRRLSYPVVTPSSIICDVGSGWGQDAFPLAMLGSLCICLDVNRNAIRVRKSLSTKGNIFKTRLEFVLASATNLPFRPYSIDLITCFSVLDHLPTTNSVRAALREFSRAVKDFGYVAITFPNKLFVIGTISMKAKQKIETGTLFERRFTPREMRKMMILSGLTPIAFDSKYPTKIGATLQGNLPRVVSKIPTSLIEPFFAAAESLFQMTEKISWLRSCGARFGYLCQAHFDPGRNQN